MTSNHLVTCSDCGRQFNAAVLQKCPRCASLLISKQAQVGADENQSRMDPVDLAQIAEERKKRDALNRQLGPAKIAEYGRRLKREIAEVEYQIWRALQPEWKESVEKYTALNESLNIANKPSSNSQQLTPNPLVAGVGLIAVNTAFMRNGINEINNHFNENSGNSGENSDLGSFDPGSFG